MQLPRPIHGCRNLHLARAIFANRTAGLDFKPATLKRTCGLVQTPSSSFMYFSAAYKRLLTSLTALSQAFSARASHGLGANADGAGADAADTSAAPVTPCVCCCWGYRWL